MNNTNLVQQYKVLTPWERIPLMFAASVRGDDVEHDRLTRSAPRNSFWVADFWGLAAGISQVAKAYVIHQLDLAVVYWRVTFALELGRLDRPEQGDRMWKALKLLAYRYVVTAEGWRSLCQELQLDADTLLRELPGYDTLVDMESDARQIAFSAEEALAYAKERFVRQAGADADPSTYRLETAEGVARSMRASLQELVDSWS